MWGSIALTNTYIYSICDVSRTKGFPAIFRILSLLFALRQSSSSTLDIWFSLMSNSSSLSRCSIPVPLIYLIKLSFRCSWTKFFKSPKQEFYWLKSDNLFCARLRASRVSLHGLRLFTLRRSLQEKSKLCICGYSARIYSIISVVMSVIFGGSPWSIFIFNFKFKIK